jgi:hypothetical protein
MDLPILAIEPDLTLQAFAILCAENFVPTNLATERLNVSDDSRDPKMLVWELAL